MPTLVSVVIICCNAAATIQKTLASAALLTDDVVVVDSGSTDGTLALIQQSGATLIRMEWMGFGANKNKGNAAAKSDWILSLDADEELSAEAITSIKSLDYSNRQTAYALHRLNYLGSTPVKHGEWNNDWTIRLFNRKEVRLMLAPSFSNHRNEVPIVKTIASEQEGIKELFQKIKEHQVEAFTNEKQYWLLAEKAFQLIQQHRMKDIDKTELKQKLEAAGKELNLYRFVEAYFQKA